MDAFDFRNAAARAQEEGIVVNALFAGGRDEGVKELWPLVAQHGLGNFSAIDLRAGLLQIPTPQDETLIELNQRLNGTYLPYGPRGAEGLANQVAQDSNASRLGVESCSSRIVAKGSALYTNASWDLVDATLEDGFRWSLIHDDDLPPELRAMSVDQRIAFVEAKRTEREAIQALIQEVSAERETFLLATLESERQDAGDAMRRAIREQARAAGFDC